MSKVISEADIEQYENKRNNLMVPDPWSDPFCDKNGLVVMYIESTIAEIVCLRAELEPGVKLICPNPVYTTYHNMLIDLFKERKDKNADKVEELYRILHKFIETEVIHRSLKIVTWTGYVPDIRLLNTIEEAMGWLYRYVKS